MFTIPVEGVIQIIPLNHSIMLYPPIDGGDVPLFFITITNFHWP